MINALFEFVFVVFPFATLSILIFAVGGWYSFGAVGVGAGSALGLIIGGLLELWLRRVVPNGLRAKWAGWLFVILLVVAVAGIAIATR